jgi:hypothetical protein
MRITLTAVKSLRVLTLLALLGAFSNLRGAEQLILDCDPGLDCDDISDISIAHALRLRGEIDLLATMGSNTNEFVTPLLVLLNRWYGGPATGVGYADDGPYVRDGAGEIGLHFYDTAPLPAFSGELMGATALYRKILASKPAHSVTIVFTGQLRNLYNVWKSKPDAFSQLSGQELLRGKVKQLVVVGGYFPSSGSGNEYNLASDLTAAMTLNEIRSGVPVTFCGIEVGDPIFVPDGMGVGKVPTTMSVGQFPVLSPVNIFHTFQGATNRPAWGSMGLWYAARGASWEGTNTFSATSGFVTVSSVGGTEWTLGQSNQQYLRALQSTNYYRAGITQLMIEANAPQRAYAATQKISLNVTLDGNEVALTWSGWATGYAPQCKSEVSAVDWQPLLTPMTHFHQTKIVRLPVSPGAQMFRLVEVAPESP